MPNINFDFESNAAVMWNNGGTPRIVGKMLRYVQTSAREERKKNLLRNIFLFGLEDNSGPNEDLMSKHHAPSEIIRDF